VATLFGDPERYPAGLTEVAPGVHAWLQPNGAWGESNAGLIAGEGESLLVDTLWDLRLTVRMLDAIAALEPEVVVPGHGPAGDVAGLEPVRACWTYLEASTCTRSTATAGAHHRRAGRRWSPSWPPSAGSPPSSPGALPAHSTLARSWRSNRSALITAPQSRISASA
jgi:hypothetical protein